MAVIATGNTDDALDIVQDAMLKLVKHYQQRSADEWGPLLQTILQSTIRDWYRRQKVRNQWRSFFGFTAKKESEVENPHSPEEQVVDQASYSLTQRAEHEPDMQLKHGQSMQALEQSLHQLPLRQQQAFLLRVWEGLSVKETAQAMQCSTGSVKTHFSRAIHSLRNQLEEYH